MRSQQLALRVVIVAGVAILTGSAFSLIAAPVQNPPAAGSPVTTGLILGTVVDAGTNKGVSGAIVNCLGSASIAAGAAPGSPVAQYRTQIIADDQGRFVFRDLPPGRYTLSAAAQGYTNGTYGARRPGGLSQQIDLSDGAKVRDATVRVWKFASITGRVVDDLGEPVVQAVVDVFAREFVAGRPRFRSMPNPPRTDDRGQYYTTGLVPGDYVVGIVTSVSTMPASTRAALDSATGPARTELMSLLSGMNALDLLTGLGNNTYRVGDLLLQASSNGLTLPPPTSDGRISIYPTTFYPAAASAGAATPITIASGEERRGVDVTLRLGPSSSVSGTLSGPAGLVGNVSVVLSGAVTRDLTGRASGGVASTSTDAAGHFTFLGVPPGTYTLEASRMPRAASTSVSTSVTVETPTGTRTMSTSRGGGPAPLSTEPAYFASRALSVGEANVANADMSFNTAGTMTGRIEFDGTRERPSADVLARSPILFESVDGRAVASVPRGQIDPAGTFATTGVLPGRYALRVSGGLSGWTARSAMWKGQDLLDEPFDADGSSITDVVITFSDRSTQLTGVVKDAQGRADSTATVLFFTSDRARWSDRGANSRRVRSVRVTTTGSFTIGGAPAGDYYVLAIDDASIGDWQDPKRLEAFVRLGTRLTIADGEQRAVDLKTVVVR